MFKRNCQILLLLSVGLAGCSSSDIGKVTGTVTLDGKPLEYAKLEFFPQPAGGLSSGRTDKDGHYQLYFGRDEMGAKVGEHLVQIRTAGAGPSEGDYGSSAPEKIPLKYNTKSELKATVKPGSNTIDFDLESKGKIVQPGGY